MKRTSIRKQLLVLFVPLLFSLWVGSSLLSYWLVSNFSSELFDRDLINSADSVVGRLRLKEGKVVADLPPAAQAILREGEADKLYYRVLSAEGIRISGDSNLPQPSNDLEIDVPKLSTAYIDGKEVRLAEIKSALSEDTGTVVFVQVAETTNARGYFQERMLLGILIPQIFVVGLGLSAAWYGISRILAPMRLLQDEVANRSPSDLGALGDHEIPVEVYPLVRALNNLLDRLRDEHKAHKRFIANAAHQLRTPLAGLKTYTSIGLEFWDAKDLRHIISELDQGVDRACRMVSQLLALARTEGEDSEVRTSKRQLDLNFVVSDVVSELVERAVQKELDLTFECSLDPAVIYGDETGLRHLVANIVDNAITYSANGGTVNVRLKSSDSVLLEVTDSGSGIAIEERERIFERFYRVSGTNGNGSGLGLSIVKEVANNHGAGITVSEGPGGTGTCFSVEFQPGTD